MEDSSAGHPLTARGRLLNAGQIAAELFGDPKKERWIRQSLAPEARMYLGHSTVLWWEHDVLDWLKSKREKSAE